MGLTWQGLPFSPGRCRFLPGTLTVLGRSEPADWGIPGPAPGALRFLQ